VRPVKVQILRSKRRWITSKNLNAPAVAAATTNDVSVGRNEASLRAQHCGFPKAILANLFNHNFILSFPYSFAGIQALFFISRNLPITFTRSVSPAAFL
jgi:hypothetical protein